MRHQHPPRRRAESWPGRPERALGRRERHERRGVEAVRRCRGHVEDLEGDPAQLEGGAPGQARPARELRAEHGGLPVRAGWASQGPDRPPARERRPPSRFRTGAPRWPGRARRAERTGCWPARCPAATPDRTGGRRTRPVPCGTGRRACSGRAGARGHAPTSPRSWRRPAARSGPTTTSPTTAAAMASSHQRLRIPLMNRSHTGCLRWSTCRARGNHSAPSTARARATRVESRGVEGTPKERLPSGPVTL